MVETLQQGHQGLQALGRATMGDDGVPNSQPSDGTATMLAIEVAEGSKIPAKGGGKATESDFKSATASSKKFAAGK